MAKLKSSIELARELTLSALVNTETHSHIATHNCKFCTTMFHGSTCDTCQAWFCTCGILHSASLDHCHNCQTTNPIPQPTKHDVDYDAKHKKCADVKTWICGCNKVQSFFVVCCKTCKRFCNDVKDIKQDVKDIKQDVKDDKDIKHNEKQNVKEQPQRHALVKSLTFVVNSQTHTIAQYWKCKECSRNCEMQQNFCYTCGVSLGLCSHSLEKRLGSAMCSHCFTLFRY